jgi:hypothetical protein
LTVVLASQTTVALPDPSSATRGPDACDRAGEAAVAALQLPPAGRVADSTWYELPPSVVAIGQTTTAVPASFTARSGKPD